MGEKTKIWRRAIGTLCEVINANCRIFHNRHFWWLPAEKLALFIRAWASDQSATHIYTTLSARPAAASIDTMLVLVIGDAHIPDRATEIPEPILKLLVPGRFTQVVSVGNISDPESLKLLRGLTPGRQIASVPGTSDIPDAGAKVSHVFLAGKFRVGVVSSFEVVPIEDIDALSTIARQLNVDILLWGGTHRQDIQSWAGHYFVNPGSLTGAPANWSRDEQVDPAGFALLDIENDACTVYMYSQKGASVGVTKTHFSHPSKSDEN